MRETLTAYECEVCGRPADCALCAAMQDGGLYVVPICLQHLIPERRLSRLMDGGWFYETIGQASAPREVPFPWRPKRTL